MKHFKVLLASVITMTILSCGGGTSNQPANAKGFANIENELKSEFGESAYYTDIMISHDDRMGNIVSLTVTDAPETMKMGQWNLLQNNWTQSSEVMLEVPDGTQAKDFMFQLDDNINLTTVGQLIEQSSKKLTEEKSIENPKLYTALVKFPKNGDASKMEYAINLKPENGGTTFRFYYTLSGELVKMDY
ncbi:hypothetical protein [Olleya sp. YS]|uniref:hypothetical protein n=1 Tax=Olleya sp. YS TaxID=3028318 RepID=UPI00243437DE|nr:hypothetical protein [Olleya sp. YS]WGD34537.1 hypothetical protein Ollyesu_12200 [Olleya sp. YS]